MFFHGVLKLCEGALSFNDFLGADVKIDPVRQLNPAGCYLRCSAF